MYTQVYTIDGATEKEALEYAKKEVAEGNLGSEFSYDFISIEDDIYMSPCDIDLHAILLCLTTEDLKEALTEIDVKDNFIRNNLIAIGKKLNNSIGDVYYILNEDISIGTNEIKLGESDD